MTTVYFLNAFSDSPHKGNPAAAAEFDTWPSDKELLKLAQTYAYPVSAYVVKKQGHYDIRWFSQTQEINLCGHGTLAAAEMLFIKEQICQGAVHFCSPYGDLCVEKHDGTLSILLPQWEQKEISEHDPILSLLNLHPQYAFKTRDLVTVLSSEEEVKQFQPNFDTLNKMQDHHALIVTARGNQSDYVLRYFAPKIGINEDPATGSAHCSLAPYWVTTLARSPLRATQLSARGGDFSVSLVGNHVKISAKVTFLNKHEFTAQEAIL
ncbi:PhzF family phenazine biosynthesis protein [Vibrio sp. Of7-15]|uniref:PhzF family phenazine biosynthesis protein n=1 Tax=Vibrio sp. Of7-15 TaxID=2724879 RepID=UPI001EF1E0A5|nr:PhzF family phenazine biosynthesis protein [Vibrio sp. Of7-15]MCG7498095.1 PhzF family phenazine biosynthesis protein [Vibrio sp. Of7-15]